LKGRKAVQSYEAFNNQYSVPTNSDQKKRTPDIEQPVIRTHPISGRKALYICPGMTTQIVGLPEDESRDLLDYLFDWSVKPEFVYNHNWAHGDALLWDNAATMHRREPFDGDEERLMKRTTILPPADLAVPV
jgi:taurine dioxygenase